MEKDNPDAAELARGIHGGKWPLDLADIVETKTDGVAKPRFRLADGIDPNASAMAFKSAFDEVQRQEDMLKRMGIAPDLLKQIDYQKEMEKLIGSSAGSLANASYMDELKRNQDMLRVMNPSASDIAAEVLGRQLGSMSGFDTASNAYLQSQSVAQTEIEKAMGSSIGTVAEAMRQHASHAYVDTVADTYRQAQYPQQTELEKITAMVGGSVADSMGQLDRAGLDAVMGRYHHPTTSEMLEQMERECIRPTMPVQSTGMRWTRPIWPTTSTAQLASPPGAATGMVCAVARGRNCGGITRRRERQQLPSIPRGSHAMIAPQIAPRYTAKNRGNACNKTIR